jgi:hypothetical protein
MNDMNMTEDDTYRKLKRKLFEDVQEYIRSAITANKPLEEVTMACGWTLNEYLAEGQRRYKLKIIDGY